MLTQPGLVLPTCKVVILVEHFFNPTTDTVVAVLEKMTSLNLPHLDTAIGGLAPSDIAPTPDPSVFTALLRNTQKTLMQNRSARYAARVLSMAAFDENFVFLAVRHRQGYEWLFPMRFTYEVTRLSCEISVMAESALLEREAFKPPPEENTLAARMAYLVRESVDFACKFDRRLH